MEINIEEVSATKRKLEMKLSPGEFLDDYNKILKIYSRTAKVPGFRVGKVPLNIIERLYGKEAVNYLLDENLLPRLKEEIDKRSKPVRSPVLKDWNFDKEKGVTLVADYEELPDFDVQQYKGIKIEVPKIQVNKEELVDKTLKELREKNAVAQKADREAEKGDQVLIKIQLVVPETKRRLPEQRFVLSASEEGDLENRVLGKRAGDKFSFEESYPEDYPSKKMAGKTFIHEVEILEVRETKYPEIDDEFAKSLGFKSLEELKKHLRKVAEEETSKNREEMINNAVLSKLIEENKFPAPDILVDEAYRELATSLLMSFSNKGLRIDKEKWSELSKDVRRNAERKVMETLLLLKIAEKEGLKAEAKEINKEIKRIAKSKGIPQEVVKSDLEKRKKMDELKESILTKKALKLVVESVIIEETEKEEDK